MSQSLLISQYLSDSLARSLPLFPSLSFSLPLSPSLSICHVVLLCTIFVLVFKGMSQSSKEGKFWIVLACWKELASALYFSNRLGQSKIYPLFATLLILIHVEKNSVLPCSFPQTWTIQNILSFLLFLFSFRSAFIIGLVGVLNQIGTFKSNYIYIIYCRNMQSTRVKMIQES